MAIIIAGCFPIGPSGDGDGENSFTLKFVNTGTYAITAMFLEPVKDTVDWGASILPVSNLDSMEYILIPGIAKGPVYAFACTFDSAGTVARRTFGSMFTSGAPDTITAFSALGPGGDGHGYNWGLQYFNGEKAAQGQ